MPLTARRINGMITPQIAKLNSVPPRSTPLGVIALEKSMVPLILIQPSVQREVAQVSYLTTPHRMTSAADAPGPSAIPTGRSSVHDRRSTSPSRSVASNPHPASWARPTRQHILIDGAQPAPVSLEARYQTCGQTRGWTPERFLTSADSRSPWPPFVAQIRQWVKAPGVRSARSFPVAGYTSTEWSSSADR